ncbi:MAG: choice-of-anchor tandem repeat GloVer-containing protein [Thermosynechococcaceae cyanobacterium]
MITPILLACLVETVYAQPLEPTLPELKSIKIEKLLSRPITQNLSRTPHLNDLLTLNFLGNFGSGEKGYWPNGVIQARNGNFYGTTQLGGKYDLGTVFKMSPDGNLKTVIDFNTTGAKPFSTLLQTADGSFYGITGQGGSSAKGTVFQVTPNGRLKILANFNGINGAEPRSALILAKDGNFYGTTTKGSQFDRGTIYRMASNGQIATLVSFKGTNGASPYAALLQAKDGNFYGTTKEGGKNHPNCFAGCGTIFKMEPNGKLTTLKYFNGLNGGNPDAPLIQASNGALYGTSTIGGK